MFGITIDGPGSIFCDNETVYQNTSVPESTLSEKHHSIAYHGCREASTEGTVQISKEGTKANLVHLFTNMMTVARRVALLE